MVRGAQAEFGIRVQLFSGVDGGGEKGSGDVDGWQGGSRWGSKEAVGPGETIESAYDIL